MWRVSRQGIDAMRQHAEVIELENARFDTQAAGQTTDLAVKDLLLKLAAAEKGHESLARKLGLEHVTDDVKSEEKDTEKTKKFIDELKERYRHGRKT